jgi:transcriptional regulator with XRE-family HTH domain
MPKQRSAKPKTEFARRLIAVREKYGLATGREGLGQKEFARILGFGEGQEETYRRYERGETEPPLRVLAEIHRVTGASLDALIGGGHFPFRQEPTPAHPAGNVKSISLHKRVTR